MTTERKVILYIAASLDGYIAQPNDDLSFLSIVQKEGEDYGYEEFEQSVDTVILGRKTYEWVMKEVGYFPHFSKNAYVITRKKRKNIDRIFFYTECLTELIIKLKHEPGKNIFCDGGSEITNELLKRDLIDEFIISVIPILTGNGIRLFHDGRPESLLQLMIAKTYDTGLVQLHYRRK